MTVQQFIKEIENSEIAPWQKEIIINKAKTEGEEYIKVLMDIINTIWEQTIKNN